MANPSILVEIGAKINQFLTDLNDAESALQKFATKSIAIGAGLTAAVTLPIIALGNATLKAASDAQETASKFGVVFRDIQGSAEESFKILRNEYGLSTTAAKGLLAGTGDLLTGFGFSQKAALDLSTEVAKLGTDLASFGNFAGGAEGATKALTSALLGEREAVKALGIVILEEDVQKQVAINTAKGLTFETERQAKAYATLDIALAQSKNAIGDAGKTMGEFANQQRIANGRIQELSESLGTIFLPLANKIVGVVVKIAEFLNSLSDTTKTVIVVIAGLAAAVGPVLLGIGTFIKVLPILITGLGALKTAITGPIGLALIATTALIAGFSLLVQNTRLSEEALKKQSEALNIFKTAAEKVVEANNLITQGNIDFATAIDTVREKIKEGIKAKIEDIKVTLLQAKAANELAVAEARKQTFLDKLETVFLPGLLSQQRRVNQIQKEGSEETSALTKELNKLTLGYLTLGNAIDGNKIIDGLGLIGGLTEKINLLNEARNLAKDQEEINLIDSKISKLEKQLALIDAISKRANSDISPALGVLAPRDSPFAGGTPFRDSEDSEFAANQGIINILPSIEAAKIAGKKAMDAYFAEVKAYADQFSGELQQVLENGITNTFINLGASIGEAIATGANVLQAVGQSLLRSLGNFLGELGQMMIAYGTMAIVKAKLDASLLVPGAGFVTGPLAIAAGLALVALSSGIGAKASGKGGGGGGGGSGGGSVGSGVSSQTFGGSGFSSNAMNLNGEFTVRGTDLVYVLNRVQDKNAKG
jgi:hypothetical protein